MDKLNLVNWRPGHVKTGKKLKELLGYINLLESLKNIY
jgi:hypothetical protein